MEKNNIKKEETRIVSHIVSLVLGIISTLSTFFWYISFPTGITAIILGAKTYKSKGSKLGLTGMITGIVGVTFCALIYVSLIILILMQRYF